MVSLLLATSLQVLPLLSHLKLLQNCSVGRDLKRNLPQHKPAPALISDQLAQGFV